MYLEKDNVLWFETEWVVKNRKLWLGPNLDGLAIVTILISEEVAETMFSVEIIQPDNSLRISSSLTIPSEYGFHVHILLLALSDKRKNCDLLPRKKIYIPELSLQISL